MLTCYQTDRRTDSSDRGHSLGDTEAIYCTRWLQLNQGSQRRAKSTVMGQRTGGTGRGWSGGQGRQGEGRTEDRGDRERAEDKGDRERV